MISIERTAATGKGRIGTRRIESWLDESQTYMTTIVLEGDMVISCTGGSPMRVRSVQLNGRNGAECRKRLDKLAMDTKHSIGFRAVRGMRISGFADTPENVK